VLSRLFYRFERCNLSVVALFSSLFDKMSHFGSDPSLTQLRLPIKTKKGTKPMAIKPALTDLDITTADSGYYEGFSKFVPSDQKRPSAL
jgi:hypothetical protein